MFAFCWSLYAAAMVLPLPHSDRMRSMAAPDGHQLAIKSSIVVDHYLIPNKYQSDKVDLEKIRATLIPR
jgi:hypothetical protein